MNEELEPRSGGRSLRVSPHLVGAVLLGGALAAFVFQNTRRTRVTWLFFHVTQPLWVELLVTVAAALVAGELVAATIRRSRRKKS